jgi:tetratricopeptide (TPR) repeat protein
LADAHRIVENFSAAEESLAHVTALLEPEGMDAERSRFYRISGSLKFMRAEDSLAEQELALKHALRAGDLELEARAWSCLGDAFYTTGQARKAYEHFSRCVDLCERHGLHRVEMYQHYMLGILKWQLGDCRDGIARVEHGLELACRAGHLRAEMVARETLGLLLGEAAEYPRALREIELALSLAERVGSRMFVVLLLGMKAEVLLRSGNERLALEVTALLQTQPIDDFWWLGRALVISVLARVAPTFEAMDAILNARSPARRSAGGVMELWFHSRCAETCVVRGHLARAEFHANALLALAPDSHHLVLQAHRVLALVAYCRGARDPELLERIAQLRAEAERGGYGATTEFMDRILAGEVSG